MYSMYVCMNVYFCHLHWCAPATASHNCRLWGPTTSLTHPLHTYIPHIYKDKFHKYKCFLFNVCMYVYHLLQWRLVAPRERRRRHSPIPRAHSRTRAHRTVSLIPVKWRHAETYFNAFIHTYRQRDSTFAYPVLHNALYNTIYRRIFSWAFFLHWRSLSWRSYLLQCLSSVHFCPS